MKTIVVYSSKRGSAEAYGKAFAEKEDFECYEQESISENLLNDCGKFYYFGGLYAGQVRGLSSFKKKLQQPISITIISVGLTSKNDQERLEEVSKGILAEFPQAEVHHLRGRLIKSQMNLPEKMIMKVINKAGQKKPVEEKSDLEQAVAEVVQAGSADFINLADIETIK